MGSNHYSAGRCLLLPSLTILLIISSIIAVTFAGTSKHEGLRFCNHCKWNESIFTCPDGHDYHSIACPPEVSKCLKILGNFTAWNAETSRYSVIAGTQRVCLTKLSAQHITIWDNSPAGCRRNISTDTTIGPWRFKFHGDYCICDTDNCNHAGKIVISFAAILTGIVAQFFR